MRSTTPARRGVYRRRPSTRVGGGSRTSLSPPSSQPDPVSPSTSTSAWHAAHRPSLARPNAAHRPSLARPHAAPAGMCFSDACQAAQDRAFALAVLLPLAGLGVAVVRWATAKPSPTTRDGRMTFEDPTTGLAFDAGPGEAPEMDAQGRLAYRAVSYTPQPVEAGAPGDRVRVAVGPVSSRAPRTFVFERLLGPRPSRVFGVTLPRPLGITWAEDGRGRVVVGSLAGEAARRADAAALDPLRLGATALAPGDLLRGITATTVVFRGVGALAGWSAGTREVVLFGADGARWSAVRGALRKGDAADGDVTVVVVRALGGVGWGRKQSGGSLGGLTEELNPDR